MHGRNSSFLVLMLLAGGCRFGGANEQTLLLSSAPPSSTTQEAADRAGFYTLVRLNPGAKDTVIRRIRASDHLVVAFHPSADGTLSASAGRESIALPPGEYAWRFAEFSPDDWDYEHYWSDPGKAAQTVLIILAMPIMLIAGLLFGARLPFG